MNRTNARPLALIIVDGWGYSTAIEGNAIALAHTPYYDNICQKYPHTLVSASGSRVGLAPGAAGTPEAGHLNIGAGHVIGSDSMRIERAVESGEFLRNPVLSEAFSRARERGSAVHLIGLLSDGGEHSLPETLYALLQMAKTEDSRDVFVHCFLDGRDVQPRTADIYIDALELKIGDIGVGRIASACGRYYGMDTSVNWERTARAFTMMVHGEGDQEADAGAAVRDAFTRGISDEFVEPIVVEKTAGRVKKGDVAIFFNHRADGMRQLARSFASSGIDTICMVEYDAGLKLPVVFPPADRSEDLAETLAAAGLGSAVISETRRSLEMSRLAGWTNHAQTIMFNTVADQLLSMQPESSSFKIADAAISNLEAGEFATIFVSLPAADIAASSGVLQRTVEAAQFVDTCLGGIVESVQQHDGIAVITSSHGRCEAMLNEITGDPVFRPTCNSVPFHIVGDEFVGIGLRENGALEDVAPTILGLLGIEKPTSMTGTDLRS